VLDEEREEVSLLVAKMRHSPRVEEGQEVSRRCEQSTGRRTGAARHDEGTVLMMRERDTRRVSSRGNLNLRDWPSETSRLA
jgi:hypothetical protein